MAGERSSVVSPNVKYTVEMAIRDAKKLSLIYLSGYQTKAGKAFYKCKKHGRALTYCGYDYSFEGLIKFKGSSAKALENLVSFTFKNETDLDVSSFIRESVYRKHLKRFLSLAERKLGVYTQVGTLKSWSVGSL